MTADCAGSLCDYSVLKSYFEKLSDARGHSGKPVHIMQIGDSHTAGDAITGAWRDLLQGRYGSGGRGVMPPGKPFQGYNPRGVSVEMVGGWNIASIFGPGSSSPRPPVGLSGFSITSVGSASRIAMTTSANEMFTRFIICAMAQPGAGTLVINVGGDSARMELDAFIARPECKEMTYDRPQMAVSVSVEGGPVTITSWASFRDSGGVALSNLGVVGSQLVHFSRNDDAVIAEELRSYSPDLIVVAFGTNEGFAPRVNAQEYEITLRTQIGRIRRIAGRVPMLLLGAPDALTRRSETALQRGDGDAIALCRADHAAAGRACDAAGPADQRCDRRRAQRARERRRCRQGAVAGAGAADGLGHHRAAVVPAAGPQGRSRRPA